MSDSRTAAVAAAVAGGYLLGRTRKAKLAFAVGSYLVGRRAGLSPGQVLSQGLGGLRQAPQVQELTDQVRGELLTAGRAAVTAAANRRLTGLADALRDRTDALTGAGRPGDEPADHDRDDAYDRDDGDYEEHEEYDGDGGSRRGDTSDEDAYFDEEDREEARRPAPGPPRKTAKKAPSRKPAPPAKKAAKKTARKTAEKAPPAKKAADAGGRHGGGRG
ncbi:hypothetical protein [Streptomyces sp. BK79]|uniref:hypothetical protein n=1 Tax=Streptomyces sp. BK79 TaxID=3350097 RepID=UPI00376FB6E2